jgi:glucose/arabinose dehydrogenase
VRRRALVITVLGGALTLLAFGLVATAVGEGTPSDQAASLGGDGGQTDAGQPELLLELLSPVPEAVQTVARPGTEDLYVAQRPGTVALLRPGAEDEPAAALDITDAVSDEVAGLVGMAFSPDGATAYLSYSGPEEALVVESHDVSDDGTLSQTARPLLTVPRTGDNDHAGGGLAFGPDGYLYVSVGDDQRVLDVQSLDSLYGKVLRVDPSSGPEGGYVVPDSNPFGDVGLGEVWTLGMKSPYRLAFDADAGDLWITDVGVARLEEVNRINEHDQSTGGVNLGWPTFEGTDRYSDAPPQPLSPPRSPTFEYDHREGRCAIIGGVLYRGDRFPELDGQFLFSDFCSTALFGLADADDGGFSEATVAISPETNITSVDADPLGNVYVTSLSGGVYRLTS